jgi:hypothetical protein
MRLLSVALVLALCAPAAAGDDDPIQARVQLPDGMTLESERGALFVHKGPDRGLVVAAPHPFATLQRGVVTIEMSTNGCDIGQRTIPMTLDQVRARLVAARADRLHARGRDPEAIVQYRRAIAIDPTWSDPAFALAAIQLTLTPRHEAIAALAPWLRDEPLWTYLRIVRTPALASLLGAPEIQAIRAAHQSDVVLPEDEAATALQADGHMLARTLVVLAEDELGEAELGDGEREAQAPMAGALHLVDTRTGKIRESLPFSTVAERADAQALLRDLGFAATAAVEGTFLEGAHEGDHKQRIRIGILGVVAKAGMIRIVDHDHVLAERVFEGRVVDATYVPAAGVVIANTTIWCDHADNDDTQVIVLPDPLPPGT